MLEGISETPWQIRLPFLVLIQVLVLMSHDCLFLLIRVVGLRVSYSSSLTLIPDLSLEALLRSRILNLNLNLESRGAGLGG